MPANLPSIGDPSSGVVLTNGLGNRVPFGSLPEGNYMITIPAGTKDLTIHLDDHGANDTIQIFTKDGTHIVGTPNGSPSWGAKNPENILTLNADKFNVGASYVDDLTRFVLNSPKDGLGDTSVNYIDKTGTSQTKVLSTNDEMIVIPDVTEDLVIFINGSGSYDVGAEWKDGTVPPNPTDPADPSCGCDYTYLTRNDDSPTLVIQARNLMKVIDEALSQLNSQRSNVGAGTNQLESSARNHLTSYVNLKNAESIIRDVDYAQESANFNKANIISQAGSYVQSQANEIDKQYVAQLLK